MEWVEKLARMNVAQEIKRILKRKAVQDAIINFNTKIQLYDAGENSLGIKLSAIGGDYSPYTKTVKLAKGQPIDRVTLRDTGDFYKSFRINILSNGDFEIIADPQKDDTNLFDEWGEEIVGLSATNLKLVLEYIEAQILNNLLKGVKGHTKSNLQLV